MRKYLPLLIPIISNTMAMAQTTGAAAPEEGGISFKLVMNVVFGVMALALLGLGIWYFKLKKDNE